MKPLHEYIIKLYPVYIQVKLNQCANFFSNAPRNEDFLVYTNFLPKCQNPKTLTKMRHGLELSDSSQIFIKSVLGHKEQESAWGILKFENIFSSINFIATLMYIVFKHSELYFYLVTETQIFYARKKFKDNAFQDFLINNPKTSILKLLPKQKIQTM